MLLFFGVLEPDELAACVEVACDGVDQMRHAVFVDDCSLVECVVNAQLRDLVVNGGYLHNFELTIDGFCFGKFAEGVGSEVGGLCPEGGHLGIDRWKTLLVVEYYFLDCF